MKLLITDHGDPSVGIFPRYYFIDCPFDGNQDDDTDYFRDTLLKIYAEFTEGKLTAEFTANSYR